MSSFQNHERVFAVILTFKKWFLFCCPPWSLKSQMLSSFRISGLKYIRYVLCVLYVLHTPLILDLITQSYLRKSVNCDAVDYAAICILMLRYFSCLFYQIRDQHRLKRSNSTSNTCTPWNPSRANGSHVHYCHNVKASYVSWRLYFVCTDNQ
jgi:hypothetical protein